MRRTRWASWCAGVGVLAVLTACAPAGEAPVSSASSILTAAPVPPSGFPSSPDADLQQVLRVDGDLESIAARLGAPAWTADACDHLSCTDTTEPLELVVHEYQGLQIRAVARRLRVVAFLITVPPGTRLPVTWLDHRLGDLGQMTFADAYHVTNPPLDPTDTAIFKGPRDSIFVDVVSVGAPGDYHGLILAIAPGGGAGDLFAEQWWSALPADSSEPNPKALSGFRSGTSPDTFGVYLDDGDIATLFGDAENVQSLVAAGKA